MVPSAPVAALTIGLAGAVAALGSLTVSLRRRLDRAASAEHELRGPLAAVTLAVEQVRRGRSGPEIAALIEAQLDRFRAGLADLAGARTGRMPAADAGPVALEEVARSTASGWNPVAERAGGGVRLDWRAGPVTVTADRGRMAQALGNLLSNAIEHGDGQVLVRGRRAGDSVRIEVANAVVRPDAADMAGRGRRPRLGRARGRGFAIAAQAAREAGGRLEVSRAADREVTTALELPLERP